MKGVEKKTSAEEFYSRADSNRTRGRHLRVKKRRVGTTLRQGSFTQRVVNANNGLSGAVETAETV